MNYVLYLKGLKINQALFIQNDHQKPQIGLILEHACIK